MKTFVLMTKMAHQDANIIEVATKLKSRVRHESEWIQTIKEKCPQVKWLAHYALLGPWDFMDIYEAPNEETAAIVSLLSQAHGAHRIESWTAIPNSSLMEIVEALEKGEPCPDDE
jgi:uncharacterized protein with GYD domain